MAEHRWTDDGYEYRARTPGCVEQSVDGRKWWDFLGDEDSVPGVEILRLAARERRLLRLLVRARPMVGAMRKTDEALKLLAAIDRETKGGKR